MSRKGYSDIMSYLEDADSEFANAYKNCCLEFLFNPRNKTGITLLLPDRRTNAEARQELIDKSYGMPEDKMEVANQLAALVLHAKLSSPDAFKSQADDLPNGLRQHVEVDLANSTNNVIKFTAGCTAEIDRRFKDVSSKKNINVYLLSGGLIPTNGKAAKFLHSGGRVTAVRRKKQVQQEQPKPRGLWGEGSGCEITPETISFRNKIAAETENAYMMDHLQRGSSFRTANSKQGPIRDIYLERTASLINFILECCSERAINEIFVERMLPVLSFEHIDFYFFFEPRKDQGEYLVPTDIIRRWYGYSDRCDLQSVLQKIDRYFETAGGGANTANTPTPAVLSNRLKLHEEIDSVVRDSIMGNQIQRQLAESIVAAYQNLIENNSVGDVKNVFGRDLHRVYRMNIAKKIAQDEIRYVSRRAFDELESSIFDRNRYSNILNRICAFLNDDISINNLCLLNPNTLKYAIQPQNKIREILSFVVSKYFMYVPMSNAEYKQFADDYEVRRYPCPDGDGLWFPLDPRVVAVAAAKRRTTYDESPAYRSEASRAVDTLRNLKSRGKLDPGLRETMKALLAEEASASASASEQAPSERSSATPPTRTSRRKSDAN